MIFSFSQNLLDIIIRELVYIVKETGHLVKEMSFYNLDEEVVNKERPCKLCIVSTSLLSEGRKSK